jgi:hypothetical protein
MNGHEKCIKVKVEGNDLLNGTKLGHVTYSIPGTQTTDALVLYELCTPFQE